MPEHFLLDTISFLGPFMVALCSRCVEILVHHLCSCPTLCHSISITFGSHILYLKLEFWLATGFYENEFNFSLSLFLFLSLSFFDILLTVNNSKKSRAKRNVAFCPPPLNQWAILEYRVSFTHNSVEWKLQHCNEIAPCQEAPNGESDVISLWSIGPQ